MAPSSSPRRSSGRQSTELNFRFTTLSLALNSASCSASSMRKGSLVTSTRLTMVALRPSTASCPSSRSHFPPSTPFHPPPPSRTPPPSSPPPPSTHHPK